MTTTDEPYIADPADPHAELAHRFDQQDSTEQDDGVDIELVVLDLAGTTVRDDGLVEKAFGLAARRAGIVDTDEQFDAALAYVRDTMGQSKIEVFRALTENEDAAVRGNEAFELAYSELVADGGIEAIDGAEGVIRELQEAGVTVAFTTGFSRSTLDAILRELGWSDLVGIVLTPADAGRGRPYPDLPLTALLRAGGSSVAAMVVVGDTASDMRSGTSAGAGLVVGVLSGAHDADTLDGAGADAVIGSVADLPELLGLR